MEHLGPSRSKQFSSHCVITDDSVIAELVNDSDLDEHEIEGNQNIEDTVNNTSESKISRQLREQKRKWGAIRQAIDLYL
jgi:hypothetical protein